MVALADTIRLFGIPPQPFLNLLVAFEQDQRVKRYDTFDLLLGYCRNSANPVGRLVLYLFGCHDELRGRLADEVCTGLQLVNFWQDLVRDHEKGRVYLPAEDLARFGVTEVEIAERRFTPAFAALMRFQVDRTRGFLQRGRALPPLVPRRVRIDVDLFILGGEEVLWAIERQEYDVLTKRPKVSKAKQLLLLGRSIVGLLS
jgi:squalene synthase HpnC